MGAESVARFACATASTTWTKQKTSKLSMAHQTVRPSSTVPSLTPYSTLHIAIILVRYA
jgi:hypothetical protein